MLKKKLFEVNEIRTLTTLLLKQTNINISIYKVYDHNDDGLHRRRHSHHHHHHDFVEYFR